MRHCNSAGSIVRQASGFAAALAAAAFICSAPASAKSSMHRHAHWRHHAHYLNVAYRQSSYGETFGWNGFGARLASPARRQPSWSGFNWFGAAGTARAAGGGAFDGMAAQAAGAAGVPVSLVERVIRRESGGNARAVHAGNYGLMQIRLGTARAMGYSGSAAGLLDPATNMRYAVRYLAGAYRAAHGNESRAVALYSRGYYYAAKAQGFSPYGAARSWTF